MNRLTKYLKVFTRLFKASLMSEMEYRVNFISSFFLINLWLGINVVFFKSTYSLVNYIGNWTESQALFFVATFNVVDSLFFLLFFRGLLNLSNSVNTGAYDYTLVKPISSIFLTCFKNFDIARLINLFFSLLLFIYMIQSVKFQPVQLVFFLIMMINGVIIYTAIFMFINVLSFHYINIWNLIVIFFDLMEFGRLPSSITTGVIRGFFMLVFPILFIAGIPCEYLFSQNDWRLVLLSTGVAILFILLSVKFFKLSVKKYSSASA